MSQQIAEHILLRKEMFSLDVDVNIPVCIGTLDSYMKLLISFSKWLC